MTWTAEENNAVVGMLAVVCEVTQTEFSAPARALVVKQLQRYASRRVVRALERCAAECRYRLTLADVVERLPSDDVEKTRGMLEARRACFPEPSSAAVEAIRRLEVRLGVKLPALTGAKP